MTRSVLHLADSCYQLEMGEIRRKVRLTRPDTFNSVDVLG